MKEIFHEFGTAILAIVTAVLLTTILFVISVSEKTGILEIAGIPTKKAEVDYTTYCDFEAVNIWHNRTKPEAFYIAGFGRFFASENANFLERYYAKDMENVVYPMEQVILAKLFPDIMFGKVLDIRKVDGISIMSSYSNINGSIRFPSAGVYEVYFQIRDRENLTSVYQIPIAVDVGRD